MGLSTSLFLLVCFMVLAFFYWNRHIPGDVLPVLRSFLNWLLKGIIFPGAIWLVMNFGVSDHLQPFTPEVAFAKTSGGGTFGDVLQPVITRGLFIIGSYWTAVTLGWLVMRSLPGREDRNGLIIFSGFCCLFLSPLVCLILYVNGLAGMGMAALVWLVPVAHLTMPPTTDRDIPPIYSRAIARINMGKYGEAEMEVIRELEEHEDDFDGWMMLAELYANHFHDLAEAERTIYEICSQPNATEAQVSMALQRLAHWHLKLGEDPAAARRVYSEMCKRLPNSNAARLAQQRIRELPATRELLRDQRRDRPIHMPSLNENLVATDTEAEINKREAAALANQYVEKLKENPNDSEAREELARVFAERLGKIHMALEQIELLLGMPEQPEQKRVEWLGLTAAWQIKYQHDTEAGRKILEQLIKEYPQSPQAFAARMRIRLIDEELKLRKAGPAAST